MNDLELRDLGGGTMSGLLASRASWAPGSLAVIFEGREISYGELDRQATEVAAGLLRRGLSKGDRVAILLDNRPEFLAALYGTNRAGLVSVSVNTGFKGDFLSFPIERSEARLLVTEARFADQLKTIRATLPHLEAIVFLDGVPDSFSLGAAAINAWEDLLDGEDAVPEFAPVHPDDTIAITFTSGTTGRSKGVVSPCLSFVIMAREATEAFAITPRDRMYCCTPLFHGMAQITTCATALYAGAAIVLTRNFSVSRFWDEVRRTGATHACALGSMLHMLLTKPQSDDDRDHKITRFFAAPAPADVLYRFERRFGVHIIEGMGLTEIKNVLYNPIVGRRVGSVGKPTATSIIEIHDEQGNRVPDGTVGEIVYRPRIANIMLKGYYREPEKTLESIRDLWWRTGDMGWQDGDGFFYFFDRVSDRLRRRGENIPSYEVESVVSSFAGVGEAAAVAVASDLGESEVLIVFETAHPENFDFRALLNHCNDLLPRFMVPRYYRALREMERTPTGKIRKVKLREEGLTGYLWDHVAAGIDLKQL